MKIAVISDIHGNLPALQAALADIDERRVEKLIVLGDLSIKGLYPNETIELLRKRKIEAWVLGNTDKWIFEDKQKYDSKNSDYVEFCKERIKDENIDFLKQLPEQSSLLIDGLRILCVHGSPKADTDIIGMDTMENILTGYIEGIDTDIILSGHSHKPCIREFSGIMFANTGSIGFPFDGNPQPSYLLLETGRQAQFEVVRVGYDMDDYLSKCQISGLPHFESFRNTLINGKLEV